MNIALIGYGYWGKNLLRNIMNHSIVENIFVAEKNKNVWDKIKSINDKIYITDSAKELILNNKIDAVVIATPVFTHYSLSKLALENNKHVLVEKPMTSSSDESSELIKIAIANKKILMVDHTFLYTGALKKLKDLINNKNYGEPKYFDSTRINLGLFQPDINVLWDLAPHDISILFFLIPFKPISVNATGICHTNNGIENIAYLTLNYQEDFIAHFNCSWSSPVKVRSTLIGFSNKMLMYNDLEPSEKIREYNTSYSHEIESKHKILVDYRLGDVNIPKIDSSEALFGVIDDFIACIINKKEPVSNASLGHKVVTILEKAQESIKQNGKEIKLHL